MRDGGIHHVTVPHIIQIYTTTWSLYICSLFRDPSNQLLLTQSHINHYLKREKKAIQTALQATDITKEVKMDLETHMM